MKKPTAFHWWLTARDTSARLSPQAPLDTCGEISSEAARLPSLFVDPRRQFQVMEGFGGAFTEAAAVTWQLLDEAGQSELLRRYFDPVAGHGYTFCRVHMNSCDFSLGNYAHLEKVGDTELSSFHITRDRKALVPFIKAAMEMAGRPIQLLVSPWSPPAWMKSNGQMNHGGHLLPEYRLTWARCFVRFIQEYEAEGIPVWGVSVQNEPEALQRWDSCLYTAEEERDFVRDYLGPELERSGLSRVRIVIWDHNRDRMVERANTVLSDPEASRFVWGTGFHWYGENHFDHVQLLHDAWPEKRLLFTEGCQEGGPHHGSWDVAERYGRSIINDLNRWTSGWIDWNLALDDSGGPNHVGNLCSAPILVDRSGPGLMVQVSYHYLGHFSRFIRPGATRVLCAATLEALECTAFQNPDGSVVAVVMNRTEDNLRFALRCAVAAIGSPGETAVVELPPRSMASFILA